MRFANESKEGIELQIMVIPRTSKSGIAGEHDGRLKIRLNSPPVDGAANKELVKLLSKLLGVPKGRILLKSGETGRYKTILLEGCEMNRFVSKISGHL